MAAIPVTLTVTFHVDPEAWQETYGEQATPAAVAEYFEPLGAEVLGSIAPAADEWVTDADQTQVAVSVGEPLG